MEEKAGCWSDRRMEEDGGGRRDRIVINCGRDGIVISAKMKDEDEEKEREARGQRGGREGQRTAGAEEGKSRVQEGRRRKERASECVRGVVGVGVGELFVGAYASGCG